MERNKVLLLVAGVLVVVFVIYQAWGFLFGERVLSAEELTQRALTASTPEEQEAAAAKLTELGVPARPYMVRVMKESKVPGVKATALAGLSAIWDYDSMPAFLDALDDESLAVRVRAAGAVQRLVQLDVGYQPGDPPEKRQKAIRVFRNEWEKFRATPGYQRWLKKLKDKGFQPDSAGI